MCVCVCVCDLKVTQMNVQHGLIQKLILHEFELEYKSMKATKTISCTKGDEAVKCAETQQFKKFCTCCKNINDQARSGRPRSKP